MSSPLPKHSGDNASLKQQRKIKTSGLTNNKSSANLDTRTELADLVKRKAEISVNIITTYYSRQLSPMLYFILRKLLRTSKGKSMRSRDHTSRTPSSTETLSVVGTDI